MSYNTLIPAINSNIESNNKIIHDSYNEIKSADVDPELKQTLESLTEEITVVVQFFSKKRRPKL